MLPIVEFHLNVLAQSEINKALLHILCVQLFMASLNLVQKVLESFSRRIELAQNQIIKV